MVVVVRMESVVVRSLTPYTRSAVLDVGGPTTPARPLVRGEACECRPGAQASERVRATTSTAPPPTVTHVTVLVCLAALPMTA